MTRARRNVRVMLMLAAFMLCGSGRVVAQNTVARVDEASPKDAEDMLSRPTTVNLTSVSRKQAIVAAAASAKVIVQYNEASLHQYDDLISVHANKLPLRDVLEQVLVGTNLRVVVDGSAWLAVVDRDGASAPKARQQQDGVISGIVADSARNMGIGGVTVSLRGTPVRATTTANGQFTLRAVPAGSYILEAKVIGYRSEKQPVTVANGEHVKLKIVLAVAPNLLTGVVTTATGVQERRTIGNDITVLNADSIMRVAPVSTVTELLETRVAGLIVQHSSGQPGAPSRIRLRGTSSPERSNDPILIVDGVRMFSNQAGDSSQLNARDGGASKYLAPSPLDQIDPNSIETVEVFKGPSASALYGSDAGNGVIVITTKRGRSGRTTVNGSVTLGATRLPGGWPENTFIFGQTPGLTSGVNPTGSQLCDIRRVFADMGACRVIDSVIQYQALNDPQLSPLGHGSTREASMTVQGGGNAVTYSATGSVANEMGLFHLPPIIARNFRERLSFAPPKWARRPDRYRTLGGNSRVDLRMGQNTGMVSLTTSVYRSTQQTGDLRESIGSLQGQYVDTTYLFAPRTDGYVQQPFAKVTNNTVTLANVVSLQYPLRSWLPVNASAGVSFRNTNNTRLAPPDYNVVDTLGDYTVGRGNNSTQTFNAGTVLQLPGKGRLPAMSLPLGVNWNGESVTNVIGDGDPIGTTEPAEIVGHQFNTRQTTYGWYVAPTLDFGHQVFVSPGIRFDGGSASGSNAGVSPFPKIDVSWIALNREGGAPFLGALTLLRPRLAFGIAGVQPKPGDQLRTFQRLSLLQPGQTVPSSIVDITGLGNTHLHPERSREIEGGADVELWHQRVSVSMTAYHKLRYDAILDIPVAASAGGIRMLPNAVANTPGSIVNGSIERNIGDVRNMGVSATVALRLLDTRLVNWNLNTSISKNTNRVLNVAPGISALTTSFQRSGTGLTANRIIEGYPLFGLWAKPITSFADVNLNGRIEPNEFRVGDSLAYVGAPEPNYEMTAGTNVSLFNGRVSVNTSVDYQNGLTQSNFGAANGNTLLASYVDPATSLAQKAAITAALLNQTYIGVIQTVSTLRWHSLSVGYQMPQPVLRKLRLGSMLIAVRGSNLALKTNYRGKDPNVNAIGAGGVGIIDTGQLPEPRTWSLQVNLGQ